MVDPNKRGYGDVMADPNGQHLFVVILSWKWFREATKKKCPWVRHNRDFTKLTIEWSLVISVILTWIIQGGAELIYGLEMTRILQANSSPMSWLSFVLRIEGLKKREHNEM